MGQITSRILSTINVFASENGNAMFGTGETLNTGDDIGQKSSSSAFGVFGTHFLMGGELFAYGEKRKTTTEKRITNDRHDGTRPDTFLFGDNLDLELLGNKPVKFPYNQSKGISDSVNALYALVNIRRDSVKFIKTESSRRSTLWNYRLEFIFDCDVPCYIQIHFCAKEVVDTDYIQILSKYPSIDSSEKFRFEGGAEQLFDKYNFKSHRHDSKLMHYDGGAYFPVVIEIRTISHPIQVQMTMCSIERSMDQSSTLLLKPLKQKLVVDGVTYLMQEIFGLENKEMDDQQQCSLDESCGECIICMGNPRDTVILPCRHLCICNGCAETLRYKLNNCPICRSPFKALLKLRTVKSGNIAGNFNVSGTGRLRHETITLIEALNGPYQQTDLIKCVQTTNKVIENSDNDFFTKNDVRNSQKTTTARKVNEELPLKLQEISCKQIELESLNSESPTSSTQHTLPENSTDATAENSSENNGNSLLASSHLLTRDSREDSVPKVIRTKNKRSSSSHEGASASSEHHATLVRVESEHCASNRDA